MTSGGEASRVTAWSFVSDEQAKRLAAGSAVTHAMAAARFFDSKCMKKLRRRKKVPLVCHREELVKGGWRRLLPPCHPRVHASQSSSRLVLSARRPCGKARRGSTRHTLHRSGSHAGEWSSRYCSPALRSLHSTALQAREVRQRVPCRSISHALSPPAPRAPPPPRARMLARRPIPTPRP